MIADQLDGYKYRNSDIEWLGEVPEHWDVGKFGRLAFMQEGPGLRNWQFKDEGVRVICVTNITAQGIDFSLLEKFISTEEYQSSYRHFTVVAGDLLLSSSGNSWGKVARYIGDKEVILNTSTIRVNELTHRPLALDYIELFLQSDCCREQLGVAMTGSCQPNFGPTHLNRVKTPIPPLEEQKQIAAFLDYETAKIDALIEKQQQLIALLGEKRQAVISHAVTKGLNPDAPMRDSGVEWLGEVPQHWDVSRLKQITLNPTSGPYGSSLTKSMYTTNGIRVYGQQQAIANDFAMGDYYISPRKFAEMSRYEVFPGDVLITVMGTIGRVAVVPDDAERGIINPRLVRYQAQRKKLLPHFLRLSILGQRSHEWLTLMAQGSTMDGLNMQILGNLPIPFPEVDEQEAIIKEVKRQNNKFDQMLESATGIVSLLQERRTALISAAVTGKIDVRGWKPPASDARLETEMEVA